MRRTFLLSVVASLVACDLGQSDEQAAYQESMMSSQARQVVDDTVAFHQPGRPLDPLQLAADMEAFVASGSDCATIYSEGADISVDFGEEGCEYMGRTFTGAVSVTFTEGDASSEAAISFDSLSDGIVTLDGFADAILSDSFRDIHAELQVSHEAGEGCMGGEEGERPAEDEGPPPEGEGMERPPAPPSEFSVVADRYERPIDGSFDNGVSVEGSQVMSAEQGDASITESGVEILTGEVVPQAGTVVHDGPMGAATMSFSRVDASTIEVSVDGPRGQESFQVDAATGARL